MKNALYLFIILLITTSVFSYETTAEEILRKMDENYITETRIATMKMVVHGRRNSRTVEMKTFSIGTEKSFTEYLSPARERGTKMLKLDDNLWIYSPTTDRIIKISGHMLHQSVMGSDLSYEDLMSEDRLLEDYTAKIINELNFSERDCWELYLLGNKNDLAYAKRVIIVDKETFLPLKQELYGLSGTLLKEIITKESFKIENRWYPKHFVFRDVLKGGKGTEIFFNSIEINVDIPKNKFSKASLRK
jgi:outer membrane lipoprotein-sorting protein